MGMLSSRLRIGEKIGFGFGLVGLLFLGVIWQYHNTLNQSLTDYQHLHDVFGAKKDRALLIESNMLRGQTSERDFLIHRDEKFVREVEEAIGRVLLETQKLGRIDTEAQTAASRIEKLSNAYQQRFQALVAAWRDKGLDHNTGLQGAFRDAVHELESMAGHLKADRLYLQLLQIRRGEKDLGLRREQQYRTQVLNLAAEFEKQAAASELDKKVKDQLLGEIEVYRKAFEAYAGRVLANADIEGGKGPFRQSAHRIEAILEANYVPDLERNILQLRRREKDYLLRGDVGYVEMALKELAIIHAQVDASKISSEKKVQFKLLLDNYQKDFLSLVEQNRHIQTLTEEMRKAVSEISLLVGENVEKANQSMERVTTSINKVSTENARLMLWIVGVATLLGIFFAVSITIRIVGPLKKMRELMDKLAYEEPVERMPFISGGRDEVNAMAGSVNTMADNKMRFINWWKLSMQEADACRKLQETLNNETKTEADVLVKLSDLEVELKKVLREKGELYANHSRDLLSLSREIVETAEHLLDGKSAAETDTALNSIRHTAMSINNYLEITAFRQEESKATE